MTTPSPLTWRDDGLPLSSLYGDVYFSSDDGLAETEAVYLAGCGLPDAWAASIVSRLPAMTSSVLIKASTNTCESLCKQGFFGELLIRKRTALIYSQATISRSASLAASSRRLSRGVLPS